MFKNLIIDRFQAMTVPPNPKLFRVFVHEDGLNIMEQPWGRSKKLTWKQAEKFLGMDTPMKKPVASEVTLHQRRKRA